MAYLNINTGQVLSQEDFTALVCQTDYTCCTSNANVWINGNVAKTEYQWQNYFNANNMCSDGNVPVNVTPPIIAVEGSIYIGGKLELTDYGTWTSDTGVTGYQLQWYRDNVAISGETGTQYTITNDDVDTYITCKVIAIDSDGSSLPATSNQILIATIPTNTGLPNVSGIPIVSQVLTTDTGTWNAVGNITYSYQWQRAGINISGQTSTTYTLVSADAGQNITCVVTATTLAGSANATSNTVAVFDTILDTFPNPITAYSVVRLLRGAHYGSAIIRVRRSGDNAESDFGVTTAGVLNTASMIAFCVAGGGAQNGFVTTVYSQNGSGIHKTQTTPSNQLQIVSGGTLVTRNGRVAMQGASGRSMNSGTSSTYNALHNGTTSFVHMVGALKSASEGLLSNNGGSSAQIGTYIGSNTTQRLVVTVTNGTAGQAPINATSANNVFTASTQIILGVAIDADNATAGSRLSAFINGGSNILTNTNSFTPSGSNASNVATLPTTGYTDTIQEEIIWAVDMSTHRINLRNKTNTFYGTY